MRIVGDMFHGDCQDNLLRIQDAAYFDSLWSIVNPCQEHLHFAYHLLHGRHATDATIDIARFDHLTLQESAHDVLAAAWRFRYGIKLQQLELPLERATPPKGDLIEQLVWKKKLIEGFDVYAIDPETTRNLSVDFQMLNRQAESERRDNTNVEVRYLLHWLHWLSAEVKTWEQDLHLVRLVIEILTNQSKSDRTSDIQCSTKAYDAKCELAWNLLDRFNDVPWCKKRADAIEERQPFR